jgi:hypothetical protein
MEFLILIFVLLIFGTIKLIKPQIKGIIGERSVAASLYFLDNSQFKVINDVVLKTGNRITQIDHIVISDYGIFVIETKNYKGWIFGGEHSEYWTQVLFNRKEKLYNPIRQNIGHIKALQNRLKEFPNIHYKSIIAFSSRATLKTNTQTDVVYMHQINRTIQSYSGFHLSADEQERIFKKLNQLNNLGGYNKLQHIESIQKSIRNRTDKITQNRCPYCGGQLILRTGKFGDFWGCKTYPKCNYSKNA